MIRVAVTGVAALLATTAPAQVATADLATPPPGAMHVAIVPANELATGIADLVLVEGDPSTAIGDLRHTRVVTLDGSCSTPTRRGARRGMRDGRSSRRAKSVGWLYTLPAGNVLSPRRDGWHDTCLSNCEPLESLHMFVRSLIAVALLTAALPAGAATITGLYNTGAGVVGNGADSHWTLAGGPAYAGGTNGQFPIGPWIADDATSRWITPTTNAADNNAVSTFAFSTTFDLTGLKASTASIGGTFAADDSATIFLNGVQVGAANQGGFSFRTNFTIGSGFVAGVNTLTFTALNSGAGPTGVNVVVSGTADAVPEAATWTMMIAGFGLVGLGLRRRSGAVAA